MERCRDPTVPVLEVHTKEDLYPTGTLPENHALGLSGRMPVPCVVAGGT